MSRARNIKPSFFMNEALGEIPFEARLFFIGLWCLCDPEGKMQFRPKRVKAELFPYDNVDCTKLALCLHSAGLIKVYEVAGEIYIWVPTFTKHQNPHVKEKPRGYPDYSDTYNLAPDKPSAGPVQARLNPESGLLNPDVLNAEGADKPPLPEIKTTKTKAKRNDNPPIRLGQFIENCGGYPPLEWATYARDKFGWSDERCNGEYESFADDFWLTDNCLKYDGGRKADWFAAWRNHCKKANQRGGSGAISRKPNGGFSAAFAASVATRYGISPTGGGISRGGGAQRAGTDTGTDFDCEGGRSIPF